MSIQNIIDAAQQIEIDRRRVVAQTISRSQRIKTSERSSSQPWKFTVTPAGSMSWADSRGFMEVISLNDRVGEYSISLNNNSRMNYITEYQGNLNSTQLGAITIQTASTASISITDLPDIGDTITSRSITMTAQSFSTTTSATYNRALSTSRSDFLIPTDTYDANYYSIQSGDAVTATTYIYGGQTISAITRDYIRLNGNSYTRVILSSPPNQNSNAAAVDGDHNVVVTDSSSNLVSSSTVIFAIGDIIQPNNSRYPYTVTANVTRGVNTTTSVSLHRSIITSEGVTLAGQTLKVGNSCTWQVVVSALPSYALIPGKRVQYTGDFELIEKVI